MADILPILPAESILFGRLFATVQGQFEVRQFQLQLGLWLARKSFLTLQVVYCPSYSFVPDTNHHEIVLNRQQVFYVVGEQCYPFPYGKYSKTNPTVSHHKGSAFHPGSHFEDIPCVTLNCVLALSPTANSQGLVLFDSDLVRGQGVYQINAGQQIFGLCLRLERYKFFIVLMGNAQLVILQPNFLALAVNLAHQTIYLQNLLDKFTKRNIECQRFVQDSPMMFLGQISNYQLSVIIQNWLMNCVDRTPSVHFNFEDTAKRTELSEDFLFELSCTNQKHMLPQELSIIKPVPIYLNNEIAQSKHNVKVKTQQFFEEFDQNFIVTFEQDNKISSQISTNAENNHRESTDPDHETISKISLQHNKSSQESKEQLKSQLLSQEATKIMVHQKQKSPIPAFSVKKRTVFKSKQNIQWRNQQFKLTKKKIFNKDTLEIVAAQSKTCKIGEPAKGEHKLFLTQRIGKFGDLQHLMPGVKRKYKSTIFQREDSSRQRTSKLENRKQIFEKLKQTMMEKTVKRSSNIFKKPFSQQ